MVFLVWVLFRFWVICCTFRSIAWMCWVFYGSFGGLPFGLLCSGLNSFSLLVLGLWWRVVGIVLVIWVFWQHAYSAA